MFMRTIIVALLLFSILFGCNGQSPAVKTVDVNEFSAKLNTTKNAQLIDVRTPEEFANQKIDNAVNIDWNGTDFETKAKLLDPKKAVFVYCKVGGRSGKASQKLAEMGFSNVYNLDGGIMKWNASGKFSDVQKVAEIVGMNPQTFLQTVQKDPKVMVNFHAKWCGPCKIMEPYILKMQKDMNGTIKIIRLDADQNQSLIDSLKIDGLPVILIYENGKEIFRNVGLMTEAELKKQI